MSASIIAADVFQEDAAKYLGTGKMGGIAAIGLAPKLTLVDKFHTATPAGIR